MSMNRLLCCTKKYTALFGTCSRCQIEATLFFTQTSLEKRYCREVYHQICFLKQSWQPLPFLVVLRYCNIGVSTVESLGTWNRQTHICNIWLYMYICVYIYISWFTTKTLDVSQNMSKLCSCRLFPTQNVCLCNVNLRLRNMIRWLWSGWILLFLFGHCPRQTASIHLVGTHDDILLNTWDHMRNQLERTWHDMTWIYILLAY
jgi:hypothetical protein